MTILSFPTPTYQGQTFLAQNGIIYTWDGEKWTVEGAQVGGTGYILPPASNSRLGGVKVGTNINVDGNGVISIPNQTQVDWSEDNATSIDYIKNKPTDLGDFTNNAEYALLTDLTWNNIASPPNFAVLPSSTAGYLYNNGSGTLSWSTPAGGGATSVETLSDVAVNLSTLVPEQTLVYDGMFWVNGYTDKLSKNGHTLSLDTNGTLTLPVPTPRTFTALLLPVYGGAPDIGPYGGNAWEMVVTFNTNADGTVSTLVDQIFPIPDNPGYKTGDSWTFHEADHGIPGYTFTLTLNDVVYPGPVGWTANIAVSPPPAYPSTVKSLGAIKLTADTNSWTFGSNGYLNLPGDSARILGSDIGLVLEGNGAPGSSNLTLLEAGAFLTSQADIRLTTAGGAGGHWTFGGDGTTKIPNDSTIRTQDWGSFSLKSDNADIVIMTDVDNSLGWTFGADRTLTVPGDIHSDAGLSITVGDHPVVADIAVDSIDEYPGAWRLFISDILYPDLGTTVTAGATVTASWGSEITANVTDNIHDAGSGWWVVMIDQDLRPSFSHLATVTFGGVDKSWQFGLDGNLTLPNGMTIDSYSTLGVNATVTIGGDNTKIRIDNDGAPPGLYITTDASGTPKGWLFDSDGTTTFPNDSILAPNGNDLRIRTRDSAGALYTKSEIYLSPGDDEASLNKSSDPVLLQTFTTSDWDTATHNGTAIQLTGCTALVQAYSAFNQSGSPVVGLSINGGDIWPLSFSGSGGDFINFGGMPDAGASPVTITQLIFYTSVRTSVQLFESDVNIKTNNNANQWKFGYDGKLTLPAGGDIVDSNGDTVLGGTGGSSDRLVNGIHELVLNVGGAGPYITFPADDGVHVGIQGGEISAIGSEVVLTSAFDAVRLSANAGGNRKDWLFDTDGKITTPDTWRIGSTNNKTFISNDGFANNNDLWLFGTDAVYITQGTNQWLFGGNTIQLPDDGDIVRRNGSGDLVSVLGGTGGPSDRLVSGDNSVILGTDGTLTLPNGSTIGDKTGTGAITIGPAVDTFNINNVIGTFPGLDFSSPNGVAVGWLVNGPGVTNATILGINASDKFIEIDGGTFQVGESYTFTGISSSISIGTKITVNSNDWTFGTDGLLTFPGAEGFRATFGDVFPIGDVLHSINDLVLKSDHGVTIVSGEGIGELEMLYNGELTDLTSLLSAELYGTTFLPASHDSIIALAAAKALNPLISDEIITVAQTVSNLWDDWQEALNTSGIDIGVGDHGWHFSSNGALTLPGGGEIGKTQAELLTISGGNVAALNQIYTKVNDNTYLGSDGCYVFRDENTGGYWRLREVSTDNYQSPDLLTWTVFTYAGQGGSSPAPTGVLSRETTSTDITVNSNTWNFDKNGNLTLPGRVQGGPGGANSIDLSWDLTIGGGKLIRINPGSGGVASDKFWNFGPDGSILFPDLTVQTTAYEKVAVPITSKGTSGDHAGQVAFDSDYIYYCTASYDGDNNIWKRVALDATSWDNTPPPVTYTLTVNVSGSGNGIVTSSPAGIDAPSGSTSHVYTSGTVVTLTASAAGGSTFAGWSGPATGLAPATITVTSDVTVTATFDPDGSPPPPPPPPPPTQYTLSVHVEGSGTVTSSPGNISAMNSVDSSDVFDESTYVNLTASPDPGYDFVGWSGDFSSGSANTGVLMDNNYSATATFETTPPPPPPTLVSILIEPYDSFVSTGNNVDVQFTATGTYSDSSTVDITSTVTWSVYYEPEKINSHPISGTGLLSLLEGETSLFFIFAELNGITDSTYLNAA